MTSFVVVDSTDVHMLFALAVACLVIVALVVVGMVVDMVIAGRRERRHPGYVNDPAHRTGDRR